jgi:transcriptional regulator
MYVPRRFEERGLGVLHALVRARPLGAWVVQAGGRLVVNHLPFVLDASAGPFGTLRARVARANEVWRLASQSAESVVIFHGPQAYVTPSWYAREARARQGRAHVELRGGARSRLATHHRGRVAMSRS